MKILFFGDVMGKSGRKAIAKILPELRRTYEPDLVIANVENLAHGRGVTEASLKDLLDAQVDVFTGGDHSLQNEQGVRLFEDQELPLIRPLNLEAGSIGKGFLKVEKNGIPVIIFNLVGQLFMKKDYANPFLIAEQFVKEHKQEAKIMILDWHAEATSEKVAMGWLLDGKVSAVLGTHTHVPTADWKILPQGTAFVSDVGMCGPLDSVIGMEKAQVLRQFLDPDAKRADLAEGASEINALLLTIDDKNGQTTNIQKIHKKVDNF